MSEEEPKLAFHDGYRSVFRFELERNETVGALAEQYVRDWLRTRKKGVDRGTLDRWDGAEAVTLPSGTRVERTTFEDARSKVVAVRYRIIDEEDTGLYRVSVSAASDYSGRRSRVAFLIEVSRNSGDQKDAIRVIHPPRIVSEILNERRVFDGSTRLQGHPRVIHTTDVDELIEAIADPSRQVALLVASSVSAESDEKWRDVISALTRTSVGAAAIYSISDDAVAAVNQRLPESLTIKPGHLRTIAPQVNFDNPDARRHPLLTPDQIANALDSSGRPTERAITEVAYGPRKRLLDAPLPSSMRRVMGLLDQEERRVQLSRRVDEQVEEIQAAEIEATETESVKSELSKPGIKRLFPRRAERHQVRDDSKDFWQIFRGLLARWLEKPTDQVSEQTVEDDLADLDRRIIRERQALAVHEQYLSEVEAERNTLSVTIAELKEENDSLASQLEVTQERFTGAEAEIDELRKQLHDLHVTPAVQIEPTHDADLSQLLQLQEKLTGMTTAHVDPREEVEKALNLLAERLGPIIQETLGARLHGVPWSRVLVELDVAKGKQPSTYSAEDPAAQLRMITERLGKWGFPFESDNNRSVSTLGQQLRELRNKWSHYYELENWDAVRAHDSLHRLLTILGDTEGAEKAGKMRDRVSASLSSVNDIDLRLMFPEQSLNQGTGELEELIEDDADAPDLPKASSLEDSVQPSQAVLFREDLSSTPLIGNQRIEYEPWRTTGKHPSDLLDNLTTIAAKERVRDVIEEIVDFEGPIELRRLLSLVAKEFRVSRLHDRREKDLRKQVRAAGLTVDSDKFVWPSSMDPQAWQEFRPNGSEVGREFTDISPVEIRNAALFIREQQPQWGRPMIEREVLHTFGKHRMTPYVAEHLRKALSK